MQLFALDFDNSAVVAKLAVKGKDYLCPECRSFVRVRKGARRQPHFFHLSYNRNCRQNGKSQTHLEIQQRLFELLPQGEAILEARFSSINRIADVAWIPKHIVFEVQCSPISLEEAAERNKDYLSQGFQTVWILSDRKFKQPRAKAVEDFLATSPAYFTNINAQGQGIIYDQYAPLFKGFRRFLSKPMPVNLSGPLPILKEKTPYPYLNNRIENWPFCFQGDLLYTYEKNPKALSFLEKVPKPLETNRPADLLSGMVLQPYLKAFHFFLKNYC